MSTTKGVCRLAACIARHLFAISSAGAAIGSYDRQIRLSTYREFVTQKAVMGAVHGFASPRLQIPELLALYRTGDLKLRELITRSYRLDEINRGYADLEAGKNLRGVVPFDH